MRSWLLAAWALLILTSAAFAEPAPVKAPELTVTCDQPGAVVAIDHVLIGKAPLSTLLAPGRHELRVSRDDSFEPFVQLIEMPPDGTVTVNAHLVRNAPSLYAEAMDAWRKGDTTTAATLLKLAAQAPGKRPGDIPFFLGLIAENAKDWPAAEASYLSFVGVYAGSPSGQYHLGRVRQAEGLDALALTSYKAALVAMAPVATSIMAAAGPPTFENIARLEKEAALPGHDAAGIEHAYLLELKGSIPLARELFRGLVERLAEAHHVDLGLPAPKGIPILIALPESMHSLPAAPANTLYVSTEDAAAVQQAWKKIAAATPAMSGPAVLSRDANHWTALVSRALDRQDLTAANNACNALSRALATDVLYLVITPDGRAWYFYWHAGHLLDQYCSNPGHPGEVDYKTLRTWGGQPNVLVKICRGRPLSSKAGPNVTMTDLNAILYFYYPEQRFTRPAAYRSPTAFMKVLAQVIGIAQLPARFAACSGHPGWRAF